MSRVFATLIVAAIVGGALRAQPAASRLQPPASGLKSSDWPMDEVELVDGRVFRGLIDSQDARRIVLIEVQRARGKPLGLLVRPLDVELVAKTIRLDESRRTELVGRIERHKRRAAIEAGRMAALAIHPTEQAGRLYQKTLRYDGPWFKLESTADDEMTRRLIVRLEQVFLAYQRIFPPQRKPALPVSIRLLGKMTEYHEFVSAAGLRLDNPAFFWSQRNTIVAGSDLARISAELAKATAANQRAWRQLLADYRALPSRIAEYARKLESHGYSEADRREELVAVRTRWRRDLDDLRRQVEAADARNTQAFNKFAARMFSRLYHEAFHAYLENYVYGPANVRHTLPRWLEEGLAQLYESAQLDVDTLRIDAPDRERLAALAADLRSASPLPLTELLSADDRVFLNAHLDGRPTAARHYLYAWGLAYYLVFGPPGLDSTGIELLSGQDADPPSRLEKIVRMPLAEFEAAWRREMLKPAPLATPMPRSPPPAGK